MSYAIITLNKAKKNKLHWPLLLLLLPDLVMIKANISWNALLNATTNFLGNIYRYSRVLWANTIGRQQNHTTEDSWNLTNSIQMGAGEFVENNCGRGRKYSKLYQSTRNLRNKSLQHSDPIHINYINWQISSQIVGKGQQYKKYRAFTINPSIDQFERAARISWKPGKFDFLLNQSVMWQKFAHEQKRKRKKIYVRKCSE